MPSDACWVLCACVVCVHSCVRLCVCVFVCIPVCICVFVLLFLKVIPAGRKEFRRVSSHSSNTGIQRYTAVLHTQDRSEHLQVTYICRTTAVEHPQNKGLRAHRSAVTCAFSEGVFCAHRSLIQFPQRCLFCSQVTWNIFVVIFSKGVFCAHGSPPVENCSVRRIVSYVQTIGVEILILRQQLQLLARGPRVMGTC